MYKSLVESVSMCGAEVWTVSEKNEIRKAQSYGSELLEELWFN
jgi:hypothetical protein